MHYSRPFRGKPFSICSGSNLSHSRNNSVVFSEHRPLTLIESFSSAARELSLWNTLSLFWNIVSDSRGDSALFQEWLPAEVNKTCSLNDFSDVQNSCSTQQIWWLAIRHPQISSVCISLWPHPIMSALVGIHYACRYMLPFLEAENYTFAEDF